MLLIRLFSRTFITNKRPDGEEYRTIVIKEIPKYLKDQQVIEVAPENYIDTDNLTDSNKPILKLQLVKIIKNKIEILRTKRRKRVSRKVGYKQLTGYFRTLTNKE